MHLKSLQWWYFPTSLGHHALREPFPTIHMVTTIVTMADNTFSFNMCNFAFISDFKKKTQNFFQLCKTKHSKFEFIVLKFVSATFLLVCFLILNKSTCKARKYVVYFTSKVLFVLDKIESWNFTFSNFLMASNA